MRVCPRHTSPHPHPPQPGPHPLPTALPQVSTHHLHSSSDDEDDRLKEFNFPEEAVLQQVGWGRGGGAACPAQPHLPLTTAPLQAFMDFQMQRMTSAFIDHFGFNDEEFGEQEESVK